MNPVSIVGFLILNHFVLAWWYIVHMHTWTSPVHCLLTHAGLCKGTYSAKESTAEHARPSPFVKLQTDYQSHTLFGTRIGSGLPHVHTHAYSIQPCRPITLSSCIPKNTRNMEDIGQKYNKFCCNPCLDIWHSSVVVKRYLLYAT